MGNTVPTVNTAFPWASSDIHSAEYIDYSYRETANISMIMPPSHILQKSRSSTEDAYNIFFCGELMITFYWFLQPYMVMKLLAIRECFFVIFVGKDATTTSAYVYSSEQDAWSEPVTMEDRRRDFSCVRHPGPVVGNIVYFTCLGSIEKLLAYNLSKQQLSFISLPACIDYFNSVLITVDEGKKLGFATALESKLSTWSRDDAGVHDGDAVWIQHRVFVFDKLLPSCKLSYRYHLFAATDNPGVIVVRGQDVLFILDLKSGGATNMPPPQRAPPALMEELVEEILLRFPPDDPARLFRAAVVCKAWCRLISGAAFRRRFRKIHGTPLFSDSSAAAQAHTPIAISGSRKPTSWLTPPSAYQKPSSPDGAPLTPSTAASSFGT
ncbi:hypothetical protein EJB05_13845 [Eragrostis curvula]|uniref:F-box domain-containing protein n=1 Tax=Eragrostis curvula TaxID=38414 RepID=A0A5J9VVC6_9POAL|nr:hypothetical protein EJB05_13845 [Eragrostis curvula]